jgi:hypothetical protein
MQLSTLDLAFVSAGILGFRHGFDYDHIAAISDITSMEPSKRTAMRMGFVYILGHAVTLGALGGAVILFQHSLPRQIDRWAERAVGVTLVLLGVYVLGSLLLTKDNGLPRSRAAVVIYGSHGGCSVCSIAGRARCRTGSRSPTIHSLCF